MFSYTAMPDYVLLNDSIQVGYRGGHGDVTIAIAVTFLMRVFYRIAAIAPNAVLFLILHRQAADEKVSGVSRENPTQSSNKRVRER